MSSFPVAAQSGRATPRTSLAIVVLALVAAAMIGAAVGGAIVANRTPAHVAVVTAPVQPHPVTAAAPLKAMPGTIARYREVVANLVAAEKRNDGRDTAAYRGELDGILTPAMIGLIYQEHERLLEARAAMPHNSHASLITRQIAALCGPAEVKARLTFC